MFKRNPEIERITRNARWERVELEPTSSQSQQRVQGGFSNGLTWLKPSQDADTVPSVPSTEPDYAGDTLLANSAGTDIDPFISTDCNNSFFDSLSARGAWLIRNLQFIPFFGNYLHPPSNTLPDTIFYVGGGVAERYDIVTPANGVVVIKGVAALILNNFGSGTSVRCNPNTGEVSGGPWNTDGAYTIGYQLLDTVQIPYDVSTTSTPEIRVGSYPDTVIREVTKPLSAILIGYNANAGQCVMQNINLLERLDHAYFAQPYRIECAKSIYAAVRYDLYIPDFDAINDTLFGLIGPAYNAGHPCLTADTNFPGRNMLLVPGYKQSDNTFIYPDEWYPQYFLFSGRGYDLNMLLFPIIYVESGSCPTAALVRNGAQSFSAPYPNPAVDCVHLNVETPAAATATFRFYTAEGREVRSWTRRVTAGSSTVSLDLEVPAGAYLLQAQTPYGVATFWVNVVK
jgi:hypothetical protein